MSDRLPTITGIVGLLIWSVTFVGFEVDDAYISLRYAANLCAGHGLTFNVVGPPVEGFSNLLWTLLVTPLACLADDPLPLVKLLGLGLLLGTAFGVARLCRACGARRGTGAVAAAIVLVTPQAVAWAFAGLEAPLLAFLLVTALCADESPRARRYAPALWLAAALVRIDAVGIVAVLVTGRAVFRATTAADRTAWKHAARCAVVVILGLAAVTAWRLAVYGVPLPNTYYAKVDVGGAALGAGIRYVLGARMLWWLLAVPALPFLCRREHRPAVATLAAAVVAQVGYAAVVGGDWMPLHRFLVPAVPLAAVAVALAADRVPRETRHRGVTVGVLAMLCLNLLLFSGSRDASEVISNTWHVARFRAMGRHLDAELPEGASLAVSPAGAIPFFSRRDAIDMLGLNDAHIARAPLPHGPVPTSTGHARGDGVYVLDREPSVVVFSGGAVRTPSLYTSEVGVVFDPRFPARYRLQQAAAPPLGVTLVLPATGRAVGESVDHMTCRRSGFVEVCEPSDDVPLWYWASGGEDAPPSPAETVARRIVELDLGGDCETTLEALLAEREASEQAGIGMLADGWTAVTAYRCGSTRDGDAAVGRAQQRGEIEWSVFEYWLWTDPRFEGMFP